MPLRVTSHDGPAAGQLIEDAAHPGEWYLNESRKARVFIVSYPRSGHHALMGFLKRVTDLHNEYCEFYNCQTHDGKAIECPKKLLNWRLKGYQCGAGRRVIKTHDFDLALPIKHEWRYIVQYRHPIPAIQSWYELESRKRKLDAEKFAIESLDFWKQFLSKWVLSDAQGDDEHDNRHDNLLRLNYDCLADRENLESVAEFCQADLSMPPNFRPNFKPRRNLDEIPGFLREFEPEIQPWLDRAGIQPLFA